MMLCVGIQHIAVADQSTLWNKLSVMAENDWQTAHTLGAEEMAALRSMAVLGDSNAQYALGSIYESRHEHSEAATWLKMAAENGHMPARYSYIENAAGHAMAELSW
jgi:TPR repeat protein